MKEQNGFSALELVVAIGIIVLLAAIAMPNIISWQTQGKLRGAVNNLKADLQMAKLRALRENAFVAVIFAANGYRIFADSGAHAGDWIFDADEVLIKNKQLPAGVHIELPTGFDPPNNRTRFNGRGFPDPSTLTGPGLTGSVTFRDSDGRQAKIIVNRLGHVDNS